VLWTVGRGQRPRRGWSSWREGERAASPIPTARRTIIFHWFGQWKGLSSISYQKVLTLNDSSTHISF